MYTQIIIKHFLLFIKKNYNYIKKFFLHLANIKKKILSAKYKNGKSTIKFVIK